MKDKIINFLKANRYEVIEKGHNAYYKTDAIYSVSIEEHKIIMCDGEGNTQEIPLDIFALIGFLYHYREISNDYDKRTVI